MYLRYELSAEHSPICHPKTCLNLQHKFFLYAFRCLWPIRTRPSQSSTSCWRTRPNSSSSSASSRTTAPRMSSSATRRPISSNRSETSRSQPRRMLEKAHECIRMHRGCLDSVLGSVWTMFGSLGRWVAAALGMFLCFAGTVKCRLSSVGEKYDDEGEK